MVLLIAILGGLLVGIGLARWRKQIYPAPNLKFIWLAFIAFTPQWIVTYLPITHHLLNDQIASISLLMSLTLFLIFAWLNRHVSGMPILIVGLLLNFTVIAANGGWMPINPQTANLLTGKDVLQISSLGNRFGEKDILLPIENISFEFLSDRFLLPTWFPYRAAFSLGDILISLGAFWMLIKPVNKTAAMDLKGIII
jgi:hypothetical protein